MIFSVPNVNYINQLFSFSGLRSLRNSPYWLGRLVFGFLHKIRIAINFIFIAKYRAETITKFTKKKDLHQLSTYTELNRYPELLEIAETYFTNVAEFKILSFGCSTGEEVESLKSVFPKAQIIGVDINDWCIRQCKKRINENHIAFYPRFDKKFIEDSEYDMIFCMAVLQRTANRVNSDNSISAYPFSQFENEILFLDKKLKKGGLFFIDHADFSFSDVSCFDKYIPHASEKSKIIQERPQYNRHNLKIAEEQNNDRTFIKTQI